MRIFGFPQRMYRDRSERKGKDPHQYIILEHQYNQFKVHRYIGAEVGADVKELPRKLIEEWLH